MRSELGQKGRTEAAKGGKLDSATSVTILPFRVGDRSRKDVADVVGLMLEREGMPHIFTVEADFLPPTGATLREVADAVAEYSRQHSFETDCVLYGEFLGAPGSGVDAVRGVLATARGDVVWSDEQTPADVAFRRVGPRNPMTCCVLFKERVGPQFRLSALTRARASEGRMAQLWEEKSHRPSKQELEKIQQRLRAMKDKGSDTTVAIYATQVSGRIDAASAENLARLLNERGLLTAAVADAAPQFEIEPSSNEQRRLWDLARAFREYVKTQPPAADYALLAEYTIRPSDGQVWTVHTIVCDSTGEWAMVDFQNEYQADFNRIAPRSCGDADRLVVERIAGYLQ